MPGDVSLAYVTLEDPGPGPCSDAQGWLAGRYTLDVQTTGADGVIGIAQVTFALTE